MKLLPRDVWIEQEMMMYFGHLDSMEQAVLRALLANCWENGGLAARMEMLELMSQGTEEIIMESKHDH